AKPGKIPSFLHLYEGIVPWFPISFLPVGTRRPGVAVPHTPVGVAQRPRRRVPDSSGAHTPAAQAPPRAETLCWPHHQAASRRRRTGERPPPARPFRPTPAPRHDARTPPSDRHLTPFLPQPGLCLSRLGRLGQSARQWPSQRWSLAAAAVRRL